MQKFKRFFRGLSDPRAANACHDLLDIIVIALAAMLCGAKGATDMALFARSKEKLLRQFLPLEYGVPSHDTFSRVLRALDPEAFERSFRAFMAAFAKAHEIKLTGVVAIDGKALRGAYERGKSTTPLHMVNVFATEARMALASRRAPGRNEAKGALEVLRMLSLEACIVSSMFCSTRMATEPEKTMPRRTSRSCDDSHSISFARIQTKHPCAKNSSAPAGTTLSFSISSATCDSPALAGEGQGGGYNR